VEKADWIRLIVQEGRQRFLLDDEEWVRILSQVTGFRRAEPRWMMKEATLLLGLYADGMEPWNALRVTAIACNWPDEGDA
jgi:hypothetical protein